MAEGSETISLKWIEGAERVCVRCGSEIKNIDRDIGEVRTRYGAKGHGRREIICTECFVQRPEDRRMGATHSRDES